MTHWIGVFSTGDASGFQLRSVNVHTFDAVELAVMAKVIRELLAKIMGSKKAYKFADPLPLDEDGKLRCDDKKLERREKNLVALAVRGLTMYRALFFSRADAAARRTQLLNFDKALQSPGIVSVARRRGQSTTFPWAALYARYLDTGREDEIRLCGIFKAQLAANKWSDDMTELIEKYDLLDNPETCRSKSECPLDGDAEGLIVCPFGFWGFLHQVEQPLQHVEPIHIEILEELSDETSEESRDSKLNQILSRMRSQTSFLMCSRDDKVRIAIGAYPRIRSAKDHHIEIKALRPAGLLEVTYEEDRNQMMILMRKGGHHLYYFYCHGKMEDGVFKLKLGPRNRPRYISAADLDPRKIHWPEGPLVILNVSTMALTPEEIHGFLGKLWELGASGVVGSEIEVWSQLARSFGFQLVKRILAGRSVGEAFLGIRRHLLRQYNPLGLVYSYYAPATLHLHDPHDCKWCQTHPPKRVPVGSG